MHAILPLRQWRIDFNCGHLLVSFEANGGGHYRFWRKVF